MTAGVSKKPRHRIETNMYTFNRFVKFRPRILMVLLGVLFVTLIPAAIATAASVSQGYQSKQTINVGTIVSLTAAGGNEIEPTSYSNEALMLGVAVSPENAILDVQPSGSDIRVGVSGEVPILVTNSNGDIKSGDYLIISQITGVAMKDSTNIQANKNVAIASESFNSSNGSAKQVTIKINDENKQVAIGLIRAKLLISPRQTTNTKQNPVLAFVEKIIGRPINMAQLIAAAAVFITTFTFTGLLLNGSVKGAFVSLGRNPLSKPAIISNMLRVSAIGLLILIVGVGMAYVILLI